MRTRLMLTAGFGLLAAAGYACLSPQDGEQVLDPRVYHLGDDPTPDWPEAPVAPDGTTVEFRFTPLRVTGEQVLCLTQRHVDDAWHVEINGVRIATLKRGAERGDEMYVVPEGVLRAGENSFAIVGDVPTDDITVGDIRLIPASFRKTLKLREVALAITDSDTGRDVPARVTITDDDGIPAMIYYADCLDSAVREGVIYVGRGRHQIELPEGTYEFYATRGSEWGLGRATVEIGEGPVHVDMSMRREVDTTGFVACDTHIHTLTFSGHGDSSVEERVVTLAGEGIELAISTDHNHNTDYRPYQERAGYEEHFTPVVGNEVTTDRLGHYNAFPLDPDDDVPDHTLRDPASLVEEMRAHGAKVVVLNHPRWPNHDEGPFGFLGLDRWTGDRRVRVPLIVDATELVNSDTKEEDPLFLFTDWFALLNSGEMIRAVGSSDSHTVGSPVGQGRTYIRSSTDDPTKIDVDEATTNIAAGRTSISMGIFTDVELEGGFTMGDLATVPGGVAKGRVRVAAPSWVRPRSLHVFLNGEDRLDFDLAPRTRPGTPTDEWVEFEAEFAHPHDAWLVCVVLGDAVDGPYWPQVNPYTLGATNPVFLDVDGDDRYSSPRETAQKLLDSNGADIASVRAALTECGEPVGIQLLSLAREVYLSEAYEKLLQAGDDAARAGGPIRAWLESLAPR